jgi:hypothetical protein
MQQNIKMKMSTTARKKERKRKLRTMSIRKKIPDSFLKAGTYSDDVAENKNLIRRT